MLENLEVIELYENANQEKAKTFIDTAESTLKVQTEKKYITRDIEWINMMEEVILMRIEEIERKISDIESTEVYKILDKEKILLVKQDTKKEIKAIVVEQMLDKMLDLDEDMTEEQLRQLVAEKYEVIKYKKMAVLQDIQKILKKYFDQYQDMVEMKGN